MRATILILALLGLVCADTTVQQFVNDNHVLNYALTLEHFEAALYASGSAFTADQYTAAGFPAGSKASIDYIASVEAGHANYLTGVLTSRGWPAVPACTNYNFNYNLSDVRAYVTTLAAVELAGTAAYDGAALAITDKNLLTIAAGIATVEARHTAILNTILNNGSSGSFAPVDATARTVATNFTQTVTAITPFFTTSAGSLITCPAQTNTTTYFGTYSVSSTNFSSYTWVSANTLRNNSAADLASFYARYLSSNAAIPNNDLAVLQYALALENLEATFYRDFAPTYNTTSIGANTAVSADLISANIALIGAHEALHVAFITGLLGFPSVTPGTACTYNWTGLLPNGNSSTFIQFLTAASTLENTGVSAYVGAIGLIANADAAAVAATIATVEGQHAAYVSNLLNTLGAFTVNANVTGVAQGAQDSGLSPNAVLTNPLVAGIISTCTAAQLGTPAPINVANTAGANFFSDQNQNPTTPFVTGGATTRATTSSSGTTSSGTTSSFTTSTVTRAPSTTTTPRTGSAAGLVASVALVAVALAMF